MSINDLGKKSNITGDGGGEGESEEIDLREVEEVFPSNNHKNMESGFLNKYIKKNIKDILTLVIIVLVATGSYGLGKLSNADKSRPPVKILNTTSEKSTSTLEIPNVSDKDARVVNSASVAASQQNEKAGMLVGSKTGKKYHFPWCSGAQRIKNENKVWFASFEEAKKAGYTPAANCKGLQ